MPTCNAVAAALRNLADSIEKGGDAEIVQPFVNFQCRYESKDKFLAVAANLPRPLKKTYDEQDFRLSYESNDLSIWATAKRNAVCRLIEPAKPAVYDCVALLSDEEIAGIPAINVDRLDEVIAGEKAVA